MSAINVSLATRNNILVYMRKMMRPVTQAEIFDNCDLPKGLNNVDLTSLVNRSFIALTKSGEIVRQALTDANVVGPKFKYRLAGPLDPTPKMIRVYKARGTGRDAQRAQHLNKLQAEANEIAAQIKAKQAEEAAAQLDLGGPPPCAVPLLRVIGAEKSISLGQVNTLAGVNVEVTSSGLTITLGKITVTIKAD